MARFTWPSSFINFLIPGTTPHVDIVICLEPISIPLQRSVHRHRNRVDALCQTRRQQATHQRQKTHKRGKETNKVGCARRRLKKRYAYGRHGFPRAFLLYISFLVCKTDDRLLLKDCLLGV